MIEKILQNNFPSLSHFGKLRKEIAEISSIHRFEKGTEILKNGQFIKVIPLLLSGIVKVYKEDENEGEVLLYYIKKGESCVMSMTALIRNEASKMKGVAEEDAEVLLVPAAGAIHIAKEYPEWNQFIYELFSNKYDELLQVISTLTFSNKDIRLLNYLKKQAEIKGSFSIKKTHQEVAIDLGSSREVISRLLKKMKINKQVTLSQGEITLI